MASSPKVPKNFWIDYVANTKERLYPIQTDMLQKPKTTKVTKPIPMSKTSSQT